MTLGTKIKRLREEKGYSQEKLAELLNVHAVTISKWENGTQIPRAERLNELAKILGVSSEYLLEGTAISDKETGKIKSLAEENADDLVYRSGIQELRLPNTEQTRELFKTLVMAMVANGGKVHA